MSPVEYSSGKCPPNDANLYMNPPICGVQAGQGKYNQDTSPNSNNDLAQVRDLGFDLVRLAITWSLVEVTPGVINEEYLERIAQVVEWGKEQDIDFIIDFHTDFYSFSLNDGAGVGG